MLYTISNPMSHTIYSHLICCVLSGGLFDFRKELAYSVVNEGLQLCHDIPENTLLNDVFFYVMYHLSSFQNMHEYQVTKDTEIFEFVHTSSPAIPNSVIPETYKISKQLVAYLETLVAFSPYYVAGDPLTQGRVDNFYLQATDRYNDFTSKEFHKYIARKMEAFCKCHSFPATKAAKVVQEPDESQGPEIGDVVPVEGGSALNKSYVMTDSEDDEEEGGPALRPAVLSLRLRLRLLNLRLRQRGASLNCLLDLCAAIKTLQCQT
jgi:hypothetical protein